MARKPKAKPIWPAHKTEDRPLTKLTANPKNARTHSDEQVALIAAAIEQYGFTNRVLIDENDVILAGHGRVLAAQKLGLKTIPVAICDGWSEDQKRAYMLADNQLAAAAGWDEALLRSELEALDATPVALESLGFSDHDLARFLNRGGEEPPEVQIKVPDDPIAALGDVWQLGQHRVACGDSTDAAIVAALMDGARPHLMVTDPPYGVEYDANWRNGAKRADGSKDGARALGKVKNDDRADWQEAWDLFEGDVAYVWHASMFIAEVLQSLQASNFQYRAQLIWDKGQIAIGRGHYHWRHEPCWYVVRKGRKAHWTGSRKEHSVWDIPKPRASETGHSTQKPIECMARPMRNNSKRGDKVYDPFLGSGTSVIAAEQEGRICYGIELNPAYVDIIIARWEQKTGKKAERVIDGKAG